MGHSFAEAAEPYRRFRQLDGSHPWKRAPGLAVQDRIHYILQKYHPDYLVLRKATADLSNLPGSGYRIVKTYSPDLYVFAPR